MKILFHISGYKNPDQFSWIYSALYNDYDIFVIHVDHRSSKDIHDNYRSIAYGHANTHFVPSIPIVWGGTGLIQSELAAVRYALTVDPDWVYLVNLSAQDYPLVSLEELRVKLSAAWPRCFVECKPLADVHWRIRKRLWFRYIEYRHKRYFTPIPRLPRPGVTIAWYGAWWHVLSRGFCEWWACDAKAERYYEALRTAGMPDEFLMQNMIQDSPFRGDLVPECKHEIIWCNPGDPLSASAHPNILTMRDQQHLARSKAFFARKFDRSVDVEILRALADKLGTRLPSAYGLKVEKFDNKFSIK